MTSRGLISITILVAFAACSERPNDAQNDPVNPVVGDASWTLARPPRDEVERIQTHLRYVANRLAAVRTGLTPELRARRAESLALLRAYAARGIFPHLDEARDHRVPRFVDPQGRLCAVGFLVAATEGVAVARDIGARYEYARIAQIDDPRLDTWAAKHGFIRHELAMIQPTYDWEPVCTKWGNQIRGNHECPSTLLDKHPLLLSLGIGGGLSRADDRPLSYFLWGVDVRYALTSWLAIGVANMTARFGHDVTGNYTAVGATPMIELSRWSLEEYRRQGRQWHVDLGVNMQHVFAPRPTVLAAGDIIARPENPYAAEVVLGWRPFAPEVAELDVQLGALVALADGYVVDDRVSAGSVMPFIRFVVGWRPF